MSSKASQSSHGLSDAPAPAQQGGLGDQPVQGRGGGRAQNQVGNQAVQDRMFGAGTATEAAKTMCDLDNRHWSSELQLRLTMGKSLPVDELGKGEPIVEYLPAFNAMGPGMRLIVQAHEEVHVANARPTSQAFKKDVDDAASGSFLGLGDKEISSHDYILASNKNHRGMPASCADDEKAAYAETVRVAEQVLADPKYASEHELIRTNLDGVFKPEAAQPSTCGPASSVR